jgi:hypothetical protein
MALTEWIAELRMPAAVHRALERDSARLEDGIDWPLLEDPETQQRGRLLLTERTPELGPFLDAAAARVDAAGALLIGDCYVDSDKWIAVLSSAFGVVSTGGNGYPPRLVFDVTPRRTPAGELLSGSRGNDEFLLHTDSATHVVPHGYAVLACVRVDPGHGGESLLMHADDIVARMRSAGDDEAIRLLGDPVYPFFADMQEAGHRIRVGAVLALRDGAHRLRYGGEVIEKGMAEHPVDDAHRHALRAFEEATRDPTLIRQFPLRRGDVLVLENSRVLHGRRSFAVEARRLLKRCKIHRRDR